MSECNHQLFMNPKKLTVPQMNKDSFLLAFVLFGCGLRMPSASLSHLTTALTQAYSMRFHLDERAHHSVHYTASHSDLFNNLIVHRVFVSSKHLQVSSWVVCTHLGK
jgi:hypothetical protein